jgi:7-keto-8-aminopelargonate synthetase-like enzyme
MVLKGRTSSFVYSSSLPPEQAFGIMTALKIIQATPELGSSLCKYVSHLKKEFPEFPVGICFHGYGKITSN